MNACSIVPMPLPVLSAAAGKAACGEQEVTVTGFMAILAPLLVITPPQPAPPDTPVTAPADAAGAAEVTEIAAPPVLPGVPALPPVAIHTQQKEAEDVVAEGMAPRLADITLPAAPANTPLPAPDGTQPVKTENAAPVAAVPAREKQDNPKTAVVPEYDGKKETFPPPAQERISEPFRKEPEPRTEPIKAADVPERPTLFNGVPARQALETPAAQFGRMAAARSNVVGQVLEKMVLGKSDNGDTTLFVRLKPAVLGEVQIRLQMEDGRLTARILTENIQVKEALDASLAQLRARLESQQIHVAEMTVSVGDGTSGRQSRDGGTYRYQRRYGGRGTFPAEDDRAVISTAVTAGLIDIRA